MEDLDIRLAMLSPAIRTRMKDLALTPGDDELMLCISFGKNTTSKISESTGISVQSVGARLSRLRQKGYLTREEVPQESGGYEYRYSNIYQVPNQLKEGE